MWQKCHCRFCEDTSQTWWDHGIAGPEQQCPASFLSFALEELALKKGSTLIFLLFEDGLPVPSVDQCLLEVLSCLFVFTVHPSFQTFKSAVQSLTARPCRPNFAGPKVEYKHIRSYKHYISIFRDGLFWMRILLCNRMPRAAVWFWSTCPSLWLELEVWRKFGTFGTGWNLLVASIVDVATTAKRPWLRNKSLLHAMVALIFTSGSRANYC